MDDKNQQQKIIGAYNHIKGSRVPPVLRAHVVFLVLLGLVTTNLAAGNNSDLFSQISVGQTSSWLSQFLCSEFYKVQLRCWPAAFLWGGPGRLCFYAPCDCRTEVPCPRWLSAGGCP